MQLSLSGKIYTITALLNLVVSYNVFSQKTETKYFKDVRRPIYPLILNRTLWM